MKFCICSETFEGWGLGDIFKFAAETGYQAVEVAPFAFCDSVAEVTREEREGIRRSVEEAGIEIAGLHYLLRSPAGLHLTGPDPEIRLRTRQYLRDLVHFCADIGGKVMVMGSPPQRNVVEGVSYEEAWRFARDAFKECSELARHHGVTLCIEPLCHEMTNFINTTEEAMKMVEEVGHPNFRWILDTYSMNCQGVDIVQAIEKFQGHLAHVHVNDDNKSWPGSGGIDFRSIAEALRDKDYEGYISVEVFDFEPDPETITREAIKYLNSVFA